MSRVPPRQTAASRAYDVAPISRTDCLFALLSGVLIALPYNYHSLYLLSWFGFVPLLFALRGKRPAQAYLIGLVAGLALYTVGAFWIVGFIRTLKGYPWPTTFGLSLLFWFYSAQLPALLSLSLAVVRRYSGVSGLIVFPVLAALFFGHFPMLFHAQLGESQSGFLVALQAVEFTGVYGLDLLIGLSNALIFHLLCYPADGSVNRRGRLLRNAGLLISVALIAAWMGYGAISLGKWDEAVKQWPTERIGMVQQNSQAHVTRSSPPAGYTYTYPKAMDLTEKLAFEGAKLVVWPEARFVDYFENSAVQRSFTQAATELGTALMFQDMEKENLRHRLSEYNAAVFLTDEGEQQGVYHKIKRVAVGEYIPLVGENLEARRWVRANFGDFFTHVSPGKGPARFVMTGLGGPQTIIPIICYEVMFPDVVARAANDGRRGEILVTMSNNGWFGDTRQPFQHLHASVLRAVENRTPLVHVMNNGPSAVIMPSGRIVFQTRLGDTAGFWADVPHALAESGGETLFTRYPAWFNYLLYGLTGCFLVLVFRGRFLTQTSPARSF